MMRHILYLVSLLQHETAPLDWNSDGASDEEEVESSDYDDGDIDEDNDRDEEDYLTDYEGLEVENQSNESNENHDGNRAEDAKDTDPAFSLPSGLWLHLSEAIFQLSMMFWTYQEPTGDMSASAIIHFTAALGIHGSSFAFHSAHASSSRLAALVWIGRLLFLEYAVSVYAYNTLDLAWPSLLRNINNITSDISTPKRGGDVVKLFAEKSGSPTSRLSIRNAAAALDKVAMEVILRDREIERLRVQLAQAKPTKRRKIVQDPNERFASLAQILAQAN
ncbi:hypothetical protein BFJ69_g15551 [Fusarium oxysporum]|uniref:Uncharacterized protein n=1 Tax=Fusarium oxysporum TaxID=5507 RepID=A0A420MDW6_FUSOX|nr:hypothetical protein BFJ69_g15551 [Fusarium oxysporum]